MAQIGSFGSLVFETSDSKVLTPNSFQRKVSGRWEQHNVIGKKPRSQFMGSDLDSITFKITLSAMHGVRPRTSIEKLEKMVSEGTVETLVIGGKKVGSNKFYMESLSEDWDYILNKGELVKASVSVTMKEYV